MSPTKGRAERQQSLAACKVQGFTLRFKAGISSSVSALFLPCCAGKRLRLKIEKARRERKQMKDQLGKREVTAFGVSFPCPHPCCDMQKVLNLNTGGNTANAP